MKYLKFILFIILKEIKSICLVKPLKYILFVVLKKNKKIYIYIFI